ncbi:sulfite exporter TauE/SafE family protein [Paenibacillus alkalitolerans]|uniref:sulfite exporter TauE/SafE family protein n=1 Tax=Paenibacillus alkalitolerans TaxID=2799335 RepID=UPI0018F765B6|nr:sulfite exporter TauE/SafE family protein [Paenibacillus alkalitolerans]
MDIWLIIIGCFVGFVVGVTGMGGGLLMTPLLILGFGIAPQVAVGTDLIFASVTKMFGAWQHFRQKTVDLKLLTRVLMGSIPGTIAGILFLEWMQYRNESLPDEFIRQTLAIVFLLASAVMILQMIIKNNRRDSVEGLNMKLVTVMILGFAVGFLVAVTSVGSGSLFIAILMLLYPFSASKLVGTDIVHGVLITGLAGISHFYLGKIDLILAVNLLTGSIPGVLIGSKFGAKAPDYVIRFGLILMLIIVSVKLLNIL